MRQLLALSIAVLCATSAAPASASPRLEPARAASTRPLLTTLADVRKLGPAVSSSFLGFSQEYNIAPALIGALPHQINQVTAQLFANLAAAGGGVPVLRLGGNSQDQAWWNPDLNPRPRAIQIDLGPSFFGKLNQFLATTGAKTIIGLNLAINDPAFPVDLTRHVQEIVDPNRVLAYEVGNEPHVFPVRILEIDENGQLVYTRPKDYDHAKYLPELVRHVDALRQLTPTPPLAAPGYCCNPWLKGLPSLLKTVGSKLALISLHRYPLESCGLNPGDPGYPTIPELLADRSVTAPALDMFTAARRAKAHHLKVRITETNSATCGGAKHVSNTFASALWAADWYSALAGVGVAGADLHMSSSTYAAFTMNYGKAGPYATIAPIYYGMLFFSAATPHNARVMPTTVFKTRARAHSNVKVWGFYDRHDHVVRVEIINKHPYQGGRARIRIPFAAATATVKRLEAPALTSAGRVSWAGQSFPYPTTDGRIQGDERVERVRRGHHSTFSIDVRAPSAVLLTVPVKRR